MEKENVVVENKVGELTVLNRKRCNLNGLKKLIRFNPEEFVMETSLGPLVIKGTLLEILKLDVLEGVLQIKGNINAAIYLDGKDNKKDSSLLTKLFK